MATLVKHGTDLYDPTNRNPYAYTKVSASYVTSKAYLLFVTARGTTAGVPTLELAGTNLTFNLLGTASYIYSGSTEEFTQVFRVTASADTTTAITIGGTGGAANCRAVMLEVTDPHVTVPFLNVVTANATSTDPTVTLAALQSVNSVTVLWVHWNSVSITLDVSADGLTSISGQSGGETPNTGGGYKINETTPAGVLSSSVLWGAVGVEIQESGASTIPIVHRHYATMRNE